MGEDGTSYGVTYDELKRGVSLGRGSVADKVFSNETVSRKHVIIFRKLHCVRVSIVMDQN